MYFSTDSGFLDRKAPALYLSSKALFNGMVPVTWMPAIAARFDFCLSSVASSGIIVNTA